MFLTRMVSGFICSKNSNKNANNLNQQQQQQQQQQHPSTQQLAQQAKLPKPHKKTDKSKRSLSKTDSKKSISELLKTQAKDHLERPSTSNHSNNYNNSGSHFPKEAPSTYKSNLKHPTKVKSGSWKRSEKQITGYNSISVSGKKSKSLRKRSPNWLKLPNTPVKIAEKVTYVSPAESTSVCRPGTLYSDVLFGAGSSCLVKIKTLTPRRNANTAQKKLTRALLKCAGNENEAVSGSETEANRELFPSLKGGAATPIASSPSTGTTTTTPPDGSPRKIITPSSPKVDSSIPPQYTPVVPTTTSEANLNNSAVPEPAAPVIVLPKTEDDADVVILSELNGVCNATENGLNGVSYGNYLEEHFKQINGTAKPLATNLDGVENGTGVGGHIDTGTMQRPDGVSSDFPHIATNPFTIDIPQWNFLDADISTDAYPKFLCQFEDEHYLKAEKMALLGLKLALGNGNSNPQQGKFKC